MQNPFKSEETAFRFVLGTIVYFALIVVASLIATWLALIVFVVLTVAALARLRGGARRSLVASTWSVAVEDTWRVLVIANETLQGPACATRSCGWPTGLQRMSSSCVRP